MKTFFLIAITALSFVGCTKWFPFLALQPAPTPDKTVKTFVELSASVKELSDKQKLEDLCAGEMRRIFERMTEESFRLSYMKNKIIVEDVKFLEIKENGDEAKVHYQIRIKNNQGQDPTVETNEREVDLVRARGTWYLDAIRPRGQDTIAFTNGMVF